MVAIHAKFKQAEKDDDSLAINFYRIVQFDV